MSAVNAEEGYKEHLIRQAADRLSPELQAEYYRILRYCRSLPENDELLLVLNAIQILFSLTIDVPNRMAAEGEKMERLLEPAMHAFQEFREYQMQLEQRLAGLPDELAKRIQPEVIAAKISESLRQQFDQTTIPETANLIRSGVNDINAVAVDLRSGARTIAKVLNQTTVEADGFLTRVQTACINGTERVARAAERITTILNASIGGLMLFACGVGIVLGLMLGMFLHDWWASPVQPVQPAITQPQTQAVAPAAEGRPKAASHRK